MPRPTAPIPTPPHGWPIDAQDVAELRRNASRLQAILDTAVDAIITIDEHGRVESFNPAAERMFQYAALEVIGQNVAMLMPQPDRSQHDEYLARYKHSGERQILGIGREVVGRRRDGSTFPLYLAVGETWVNDHRLFAGILRDLTNDKLHERQLQETRDQLLLQSLFAERLSALAEMSGGIAHELNQPLSGIRVYAQTAKALMEQAAADGSPGAQARLGQTLDKIIGQVDRAATIIRHMRDFASEPDGKDDVAVNVSVHQTLERLREIVGQQLQSHGIELRNEVDPALRVRFQIHRLEQVFLNLLTNARDGILEAGDAAPSRTIRFWSRAAATAAVGAADEDREVQVYVSDTGAGVPASLRESLFLPFVTSKGPNRGTGLGLAICHGILRTQGARISLESTGPAGTTMCLTFPFPHPGADPGTAPDGAPHV